MHLSLSLVAMLAVAPPAPSRSAPVRAVPSVAVLPVVVEGALPDAWRDEVETRLRQGLSRGTLQVQRLSESGCVVVDCAGGQAQAAGANYGVWAQLTVEANQRDYALVLKAVGADTSKVVAVIEGTCELCGFEEVVAMVEAKAAALPAAIERLRATNPVVAFTSTPEGVEIVVDGARVGVTPLDLPLSPGPHRVGGSKPGYQPQTFEVEAVEGVRKELSFVLVQAPKETADPSGAGDPVRSLRPLIATGAVLTSLGLAGATAGATLLALNGRSYQRPCDADATGNCAFRYGTQTAGAIPTAVGSALLGAGVALLVVARRGTHRRQRAGVAHLQPSLAGVHLRF